ncbi:RNA 2',3'-cyclic phosphodiesterase [Myxococcus sp. CA040A]|uniref:RNA 2',3'-cyclic phosphodiesterase n=1 Tax=Myxococcus sp. CA040A TaxID=2741738 RepID=UPI00157B9B24|nr:RNA 2',3'-cyclic phosphodiesterase [Myxococcus sp. CA040A]NTX03079.1 RNA 2',3'-cyclic phosphodiesterase [Myxococcus sp. CA040A]
MRLFTAVTLGASIEARVAAELKRLRQLANHARFVRVEGIHLTLVFLGEVESSRLPAIREALASVGPRHAPFTLSVGGGGTFGTPTHPRVLWAGVHGETNALKALQADTAEQLQPLGFESEYRDYAPHLTLARSHTSSGDPALLQCVKALSDTDLGQGRVDRLVLFESRGPEYHRVVEVPLTRTA